MIGFIKYDNSGFTLIEITIALLILAVGLVGILALFPVGFDASVRAANITKATFLAQEVIEDLKREGYDGDTVTDALPVTDGGLGTQSGTFDSPHDNYDYDIDTYETGITDLREVVVSVYWPTTAGTPADRSGQRSVELGTYIAKYEP